MAGDQTKPVNVMIGIQARSTSARFPNKHQNMLAGKMIIDHVIQSCVGAVYYTNVTYKFLNLHCKTVLLTPYGDPLGDAVKDKIEVFYGPEHDVLTRYHMAAEEYKPDYIVRITGDCPLIPSYVISKHIVVALKNKYDYLSNVHESFRTAPDGLDCEVMSARMLRFLNEAVKSDVHREHVTLFAREMPPQWANVGFLTGFFDHSQTKLSVDTMEDLERVRLEVAKTDIKLRMAEKHFGKGRVHRF